MSRPQRTMTGKKELLTEIDTNIAIAAHLFALQKHCLYFWNLQVIFYPVHLLLLWNSLFGAKKVHAFGQKSGFTSHTGVTFLTLYSLTTQKPSQKRNFHQKFLKEETIENRCVYISFMCKISSVAFWAFSKRQQVISDFSQKHVSF